MPWENERVENERDRKRGGRERDNSEKLMIGETRYSTVTFLVLPCILQKPILLVSVFYFTNSSTAGYTIAVN